MVKIDFRSVAICEMILVFAWNFRTNNILPDDHRQSLTLLHVSKVFDNSFGSLALWINQIIHTSCCFKLLFVKQSHCWCLQVMFKLNRYRARKAGNNLHTNKKCTHVARCVVQSNSICINFTVIDVELKDMELMKKKCTLSSHVKMKSSALIKIQLSS